MSKFKAGDKVRRTGDNWREVVSGEVYTVDRYESGTGLLLRGLEHFGYSEYNFELVEENMNKQFTKDQLVAGKHVVELRDGTKQLVLQKQGGEIFFAGLNGENFFNDVKKLRYDLTWAGNIDDVFTIVNVYEISESMWFNQLSSGLELIWKREEKSQQQIELEKLQQQISELQEQAKRLEKTL